MSDSSFIISPLTSDFSDVWSAPVLLTERGYSAIYTAIRFGRKYILKALAPAYRESTPYIELLRKEFSIGVQIDHPNIVRLLDFGHMDAIGWYIQMEYIDGVTLDLFLSTHPSPALKKRLLNQLLDALRCLHERQIIHRDIKPSNILVTRNGNAVKLIDFGVSDTDDYVTFKQPAGSMPYIAPEQLAGKPIDCRADIYAVGRIIELLFPHRYRTVAHKCTRPEPSRRYNSCLQVSHALRRIDKLYVALPSVLLFLLLVPAALWGIRAGYHNAENGHLFLESQLTADIDSLRLQNDRHRQQVDSLRQVVDSLSVQVGSPSPVEDVRQRAMQIHLDRQTAIRRAVKKGELRTMSQVKAFDGGREAAYRKTESSITDPWLHEEFMQAYYSGYNLNDPLYDSLSVVLPDN